MDKKIEEIKKALEERGISETQLAKMAGLNQPKVNRLLGGGTKKIDAQALSALQRALGLIPASHEEKEQSYGRAAAGMVSVPLYSSMAQAGPGAYNQSEEEIESFLSFSREYAKAQFGSTGPNLACLRASGDSMYPYIHPGDVLVVDQSDRYLNRDGAVYILQIDETTVVKRLQRLSGSITRIVSDNPTGWSRDCTAEDFKRDHIEILGRVVAVMKMA